MNFANDSHASHVAGLDPGIQHTVAWLRSHGFHTTDSGDGESKATMIAMGDALPFPHVAMVADRILLVNEADRLARLLTSVGIDMTPQDEGDGPYIEASYDPGNGLAIIMLSGVDDRALHEAKAR